jgi:hypothetical protein
LQVARVGGKLPAMPPDESNSAQDEGRRRREEFEAIRAEIHAKYRMPKTAKARAAKSGHDFLYGESGLPK